MASSLQITGDSPYGGAGYLLLRWCRFLLSKGWQVDILATDTYWISELKKISGLKIIDDIFIPRNISPLHDSSAFIKLLSLMQQNHYDVVHTYTATPGFLGRLTARLVGIPVILHHQAGWTVTEFSSPLERIVYTPLEYFASLVSTKDICVSYAVAQQGCQFHIAPPNKLIVICNGIEPEPFIQASMDGSRDRLRREFNLANNCVVIGNTGRLSPQKDNANLIKAMWHLKSLVTNVPFTILLAGDGPDLDELKGLVTELNLNKEVHLVGFRTDIPAFLAAIDIFVCPSLWEGLSISLLEAMAAAKPIVTTLIAPNAELIEDEITGLLVPPKDPKQIAQAIARFVEDPKLAHECGAAARHRLLNKYTIDKMFQDTLDLYNGVLK
jgi:glycosyltransferase involved in cell wall biosynthesis